MLVQSDTIKMMVKSQGHTSQSGRYNLAWRFSSFHSKCLWPLNMIMTNLSMASRLGKRSSAWPPCINRTTRPRQLLPSCIRRVRIWMWLLPLPLHTGKLLTISSVTSPLTPYIHAQKQFHVISHRWNNPTNEICTQIRKHSVGFKPPPKCHLIHLSTTKSTSTEQLTAIFQVTSFP